jgi:hypothetical protein
VIGDEQQRTAVRDPASHGLDFVRGERGCLSLTVAEWNEVEAEQLWIAAAGGVHDHQDADVSRRLLRERLSIGSEHVSVVSKQRPERREVTVQRVCVVMGLIEEDDRVAVHPGRLRNASVECPIRLLPDGKHREVGDATQR